MNVKKIIYLALSASVLFLICNPAYTWLRAVYEDATVVERSELIVVGHIEEGSIEYIVPKNEKNEGTTREYHVNLMITEILKGKCDEKKIPVIIHYGLTPVVGGYEKREGFMINRRAGRKDYPKDIIEVFDTADGIGMPLVKDAREDNLWFLRKLTGFRGEKSGGDIFGITDPEDLRPLEKKDYFLAYLSDHTESKIEAYAWKMRNELERAQRYLDHMKVQRIIQKQNMNERLEKLLPFYIAGQRWNMKQEARDAIIACGIEARPFLQKVYDDPKYIEKKGDVALMLGGTPKLMETLKKSNGFWHEKTIVNGDYSQGKNPEETSERQREYNKTYHTLCVLNIIGDESAVPVVDETKRLWSREGFKSDQIIEECDKFLKKFSK